MRRVITSSWRHQMETFSALLAICAGNSPVPGEFPAQRPVTQSFGVSFDLCLNKRWVNNRGAGDLRRYCAHYDVNVIQMRRVVTSHSFSEYNYLSRPQSQLISVSNGPNSHVIWKWNKFNLINIKNSPYFEININAFIVRLRTSWRSCFTSVEIFHRSQDINL